MLLAMTLMTLLLTPTDPRPCAFEVHTRIRSVYAVAPWNTVGELILELTDKEKQDTRALAQARAHEIATDGLLILAMPIENPATNIYFPPNAVMRVTITPFAFGGDLTQCEGM